MALFAKRRTQQAAEAAPKPKRQLKAKPEPVTREELDALVAVVGIALARIDLALRAPPGHPDATVSVQLASAERAMPAAERRAFRAVMRVFDRETTQHREAEARRASQRGSAYHCVRA